MSAKRLCIFGEVLFDHFPDGQRVLGGAPFNVAWHLQAFGAGPNFISRVGNDDEGESVRQAMQDWGMTLSGLQLDDERPTGKVSVSFVNNEPDYEIVPDVAFDHIAAMAEIIPCDLLYHGSLALREKTSRESLKQLKACQSATVFLDVNLRDPWWQTQEVEELLADAHWAKLNTDEMSMLYPKMVAKDFINHYGLHGLILTHGAQGAEVLTRDGEQYRVQPKSGVNVVDSVGAGDAFASVMILGLSRKWPLQLTLQRAQEFASHMVTQRGATLADRQFYRHLMEQWQDCHND